MAEDESNKWLPLIVSIIAVIATGTSAVIAFKQYQINREGGKKGSEQTDRLIANSNQIAAAMQESVSQSKAALDQSKAALDASIEASRRDQRAWVVVKEVKLLKPLTVGAIPEFVIEIINTGRTPAMDVITEAGAYIATEPRPETDKSSFVTKNRTGPSKIVLGSKISATVPGPKTGRGLPKEAMEEMRRGTLTFFIAGRIEYRDIFRRIHWTTFRYRVDPEDINTRTLTMSDEGNNTDAD